jgi:serine phosphatase RsbU (regulator of sigma subunit)
VSRETKRTLVRVLWILAAALTVFALWLAIGQGTALGVGFFYAIPVGLATWWFGARVGAAALLGCVALFLLSAAIHPADHLFASLVLRFIALVATVVIISILREREKALHHSEEDLEAIQAALAPLGLPELPDVEAAAAFVPSEHGVSGDFYLVTNGPDGSTVAIVGDVVGHGPPAARTATFVRAQLAAFAANTSDPATIMSLANEALLEHPAGELEPVSAICLRLQPADGTLSWALAGHPAPILLPTLETLETPGATLLLGVQPELLLQTASRRLGADDGVLAYTDGATDVRQGGILLGREGLLRMLEPLGGLSARALVQELERRVIAWSDGSIADDICILVLRPKPIA